MNKPKTSSLLWPALALLLACSVITTLAQSRITNAGKSGDPDTLFNCTWTNATVYPVPVLDSAVVTLGGFLYNFGGVANGAIVATSNKFDGTAWTPIASLPQPLEFPSAVTDGTNIYILGGAATSGTPQTTLYRYNIATNDYTTLAPFSTGTWNQAAQYLNGKIYKFAGTGPGTNSTNVLEIYDVTANTWSAGAPYPLLTSFVGSWVSGGFIYAGGGISAPASTATAKTYRYDPASNTWDDAAIADLPQTRWGAASGLYTDGVMAGGYVNGVDTANISTSVVSWDQTSNTWQTVTNMLAERARMNGAVLNNSFYVIGGRSLASSAFNGENSNQKLTCLNSPTNIITSGGRSIDSAGSNGVLDPGETVTVSFGAQNTGGPGVVCTTPNLTGTLQVSGGVTNPSGPQVYGMLCSGSPAAFRSFTFTVDPATPCGSTITASLHMTDGATDYGTLTYTFTTGSTATSYSENFDGVTAPALPAGWTPTASGSGVLPTTVTTFPDTAPNAVFLSEQSTVGLSEVTSPTINGVTAGAKLTFRLEFNTESTFDGLVLEISINGGPFQDILAAGGTFASGGYNSTLSTGFSNPLPGRMAWTGLSGGTAATPAYITTVVNLPAAAAGQPIQLKWRQGSDSSVVPTTNPGSRIDTVSITTAVCGGTGPTVNSAVSRKTHGAAGPFDINLPLVPLGGAVGVECRSGPTAGVYQLVVTFASPVTLGSATVTTGTGSVSSASAAGSVVTVNLAGVADAQRLGVTLNNVSDGTNLGSVMVPMGVLVGDTNASGGVTGSDVAQTKAGAGTGSVTAGTFRTDVNVNGIINGTDVSIVKSDAGHTLP